MPGPGLRPASERDSKIRFLGCPLGASSYETPPNLISTMPCQGGSAVAPTLQRRNPGCRPGHSCKTATSRTADPRGVPCTCHPGRVPAVDHAAPSPHSSRPSPHPATRNLGGRHSTPPGRRRWPGPGLQTQPRDPRSGPPPHSGLVQATRTPDGHPEPRHRQRQVQTGPEPQTRTSEPACGRERGAQSSRGPRTRTSGCGRRPGPARPRPDTHVPPGGGSVPHSARDPAPRARQAVPAAAAARHSGSRCRRTGPRAPPGTGHARPQGLPGDVVPSARLASAGPAGRCSPLHPPRREGPARGAGRAGGRGACLSLGGPGWPLGPLPPFLQNEVRHHGLHPAVVAAIPGHGGWENAGGGGGGEVASPDSSDSEAARGPPGRLPVGAEGRVSASPSPRPRAPVS